MKASLPAHLMIILGASVRLSSSWPVVENISLLQRTRRGAGEQKDADRLNTGLDHK